VPATSSSGTSSLWRACKAAATEREATPHIRNQPRGALRMRVPCNGHPAAVRAILIQLVEREGLEPSTPAL